MLSEVQRLTRCTTQFNDRLWVKCVSMLTAVNQIYPGMPQAGCLSHLSNNVFRRLQDIGLKQNYLPDLLFRSNIRMIPALSFFPVQNVILTFDELCNYRAIDEHPAPDYSETKDIAELQKAQRLLPLFPHEFAEYA